LSVLRAFLIKEWFNTNLNFNFSEMIAGVGLSEIIAINLKK